MLRRNLDLTAVTILAVVGLLAAALTDLSPLIRGLLGVPLVIALPGYALTAVLIPDRAALGRTERTVLAVGMSIAVVILVALGLNQLPAGITNLTVAVAVSAITLLCTAVAAIRRRREPAAAPADPADADDAQHEASKRFGPELLALAVILTVAAVFVAVLGTVQAPQPGFTQLWMLDGATANSIQVGIRDQEGSAIQYRLEIETQGQILRTSEIDLASGQEALQTINLPALSGSSPQTVTARLYRLDQPSASTPYRTTLLWRYPGPS